MTVYDYFAEKFGEPPDDDTLQELNVDTPCGEKCVKAIDAAVNFQQNSDSSIHGMIVNLVEESVEIFWRG